MARTEATHFSQVKCNDHRRIQDSRAENVGLWGLEVWYHTEIPSFGMTEKLSIAHALHSKDLS